MGVLGPVLLGLLAAASIVQTFLLIRTMIAGREASRRLGALEEDFRREQSAHFPKPGHVTATAIDLAETTSPNLPGPDPAVTISLGTRPALGRRVSRLGRGPDNDLAASATPSRLVGGLNK